MPRPDPDRAGRPVPAVRESAAVEQLERAAMKLLEALDRNFLGVAIYGPPASRTRKPETGGSGGTRGRAAAAGGGVETADEAAGAERYVEVRHGGTHTSVALAPAMAYRPDEIDPAGAAPDPADRRPAIPAQAVPQEV